MSNRASIYRTKFVNPKDENDFSLGYRCLDDYDSSYCNFWDDIPEDDMELLKKMKGDDESPGWDAAVADIFQQTVFGNGVYIDDNWYEWSTIRHIFEGGEATGEQE